MDLSPVIDLMKPCFQTALRLGASLLAAFVAYAVGHWFFLETPFTTDENSYVFQAHNFLEGRIARPAPPFKEYFFHPMIICDEQAGWLSRYPPAHPLWLVPGVGLGDPRLMSALAAGLSVWFLTACAALLEIPAIIMIILLMASPYFLFMHGTLLSHTSGLLAVCLMVWAYLRWQKTSGWFFAVMAGLAWSLLFLNRTYTALLLAIPFGLDTLWYCWRKRTRAGWLNTAVFAGCALIGIGLYLGYNALTTGHPFKTPYDYYAPGEALGFGDRYLPDGRTFVHDWATGLYQTGVNLQLLNRWLWGFGGSLALAGALWAVGWMPRWNMLFLAVCGCVGVGYMAFWFPGVNNIGPYYYFELIPFLLLPAAKGVARIWSRLPKRPMVRCIAAGLAFILALTVSGAFMRREGFNLQAEQRTEAELADCLHTAPSNALVALNLIWPRKVDTLAFNPIGLESQPLVVRSLDSQIEPILRFFAARQGFRLSGDGQRGLEPVTRAPLEFVFNAIKTRQFVGRDETLSDGQVARVAEAGKDAAGWVAFGNYYYIYPGCFRVEVELETQDVSADTPVCVEVVSERGRKVLTQSKVSGSVREMVLLEFTADGYIEIEPRVYYGGSGYLAIKGLRIADAIAR